MRKRRFFNTAGEKRKFFNNIRHFGQTRNLGLACMGLLPMLGAIGIFVIVAAVVASVLSNSEHAFVAAKGHGRMLSLLTCGIAGLAAASSQLSPNSQAILRQAGGNKSKLRASLKHALAKYDAMQENLLQMGQGEGGKLNAAQDAIWHANQTEITKIHAELKTLGEIEDTEEVRHSKRQPVRPEHNPGGAVEVLPKAKFNSIGEQLQAVAMFKRTSGANRDPRLVIMGSPEHQSIMAAAGLNESVPSEGGFLVQSDLASGLLQRVYDTGRILPLCNRIEISSPSNRTKINLIDETSRATGSRFGGVQSFWTNEAQQITATKPKFRQAELVLNKLMAICFATDEMIRDVGVMDSVINNVFPQELSFRLEDGVVNGPGNGQPLGFMSSNALIVVAKESGQAANTVLAANILKMYARLWGPSRPTAVWLIDQSIEPQLYQMTITTGSGISTPIYLPPGGLSGNMYGTLFGRPVIPNEYMAALSSQGDIVLADLSQYILAEKGIMEMASSMHVNFLTDEMCFRFTVRADGQAQWNAPLTPKSNSGTLSPFVTLQAR